MLTPSRYLSWDAMMMMATAVVKPLMHGSARNDEIMPSPSEPITTCRTPVIMLRKRTAFRYVRWYSASSSAPSSPAGGGTMSPTIEATTRDTSANGPMHICRDVVNTACTISGTNDVYSPCTGLISTSRAYAIACGMRTTETVRPAITSPFASAVVYLGNHSDIGTTRLVSASAFGMGSLGSGCGCASGCTSVPPPCAARSAASVGSVIGCISSALSAASSRAEDAAPAPGEHEVR
mmetsp:Transcript_16399/g.42480  ORF Transcript_16399/g.42480 Transcript_16399/m.42480 type:complete len:236 (-) Transcript_16399:41-748(-)